MDDNTVINANVTDLNSAEARARRRRVLSLYLGPEDLLINLDVTFRTT